jgi:hypothetical protein
MGGKTADMAIDVVTAVGLVVLITLLEARHQETLPTQNTPLVTRTSQIILSSTTLGITTLPISNGR